MLEECYRVLKHGGTASFTVWGRRENSLNFCILDYAKQSLGRPFSKDAVSNFDAGENIDKIKNQMKDLGFSKIQTWYQQVNPYPILTGAQMYE